LLAPDFPTLSRLLTHELPEVAGIRGATLLYWDRRLESFLALGRDETQPRAIRPGQAEAPETRARFMVAEGRLIETGPEGESVLVPLHARGGLVGMLVLEPSRRRTKAPFRPAEVRQLDDIATRSAIALENYLYQRELIASERMAALGTMAGMLAHDFRGPMTVIRGYAETLTEGGLPDPVVKERAELIMKMVDRLERMAAETLDYARGTGSLVRRPMPVALLLAELVDGLGRELPGLKIVPHFGAVSGTQAALDVDKLRRALSNLAANARDAMGGAGAFHVSADVVGDKLILELRDEGPGVPAEVRDRVFEPFVTLGKKGGTGLGLAVARRFVEDHGGRIVLLPDGPGARFRIELPLGTAAGPPPPSV
jgi:signal transduction histidine kinase